MKYFLHDSSSFNDEKITELFIEFGYEGLGLFYTILEKFALQEKPIKTKILKHQLNITKKLEKIWCFLEEIDLISCNNDEVFNKNLLEFSKTYQISKEKNAKRVSEWRDNQSVNENVTRTEHVRNGPKVKESKVNEIKIKESKASLQSESDFEFFWDSYNKKIDRVKCEKVWSKLSNYDIGLISSTIEDYVNANPDIQFRKHPLTYLNGKCWNDEINYYQQTQEKGKHQKNFENLFEIEQKLLKEIADGTFTNPFSRQ